MLNITLKLKLTLLSRSKLSHAYLKQEEQYISQLYYRLLCVNDHIPWRRLYVGCRRAEKPNEFEKRVQMLFAVGV